MDRDPAILDRIVAFVRSIGLPVTIAAVADDSFLPAVALVDGGVVVDPERLDWPGDILHEAGHLAVLDAAARREPIPDDSALEAAAMAWSYAAALAIGIDPALVFHAGGYRGRGEAIAAGYRMGVFVGLPELVAAGMAHSPFQPAGPGTPVYPAMVRWLR